MPSVRPKSFALELPPEKECFACFVCVCVLVLFSNWWKTSSMWISVHVSKIYIERERDVRISVYLNIYIYIYNKRT